MEINTFLENFYNMHMVKLRWYKILKSHGKGPGKPWNFISSKWYEPSCVIVYVICFFVAFVNLIYCISPQSNDTWSVHSRNMPESLHCLSMHQWWRWRVITWKLAISSSRREYWAIWLFRPNINEFLKTSRRASPSLKIGPHVTRTLVRELVNNKF